MAITILSEPRTYGPNSAHSFFRDIALAAVPGDVLSPDAQARLERHRTEVDGEIAAGTEEGRRAHLIIKGEEQRAGATSTTIAGFTTPVYLTNLWAEYRTANRTFIDQTTKFPLPAYGLQINVPSFVTADTFATQGTQGTTIGTSVPTGADIATPVVTIAGTIAISQQLYDQGGMSGLSFDQILLADMKYALDSKVDLYALNQVISGITNAGNTITDAAAYSTADFYQDIGTARESLADDAGVRLQATHVFSTTDIFSYVTRQVDTAGRPIITPDWAAQPFAAQLAAGDSTGYGWLGHVLPGNLAWYSDDNIAAAAGDTQILVSRPSAVLSFESDIVPFAYPETLAQNLTVLVGVREYVAVVSRFPNAHSVITGAAFATTEV
jgi:hypothetical protein